MTTGFLAKNSAAAPGDLVRLTAHVGGAVYGPSAPTSASGLWQISPDPPPGHYTLESSPDGSNWTLIDPDHVVPAVTGGGSGFDPTADIAFTGADSFSKPLKLGDKLYPGTPAGAQQTASGLYAGAGVPSNAQGANGDVYLRSDGNAPPAAAGLSNEERASRLVNAQSAGDAGGRSYHFDVDGSMGPFSALAPAPASSAIKNSVLAWTSVGGQNPAANAPYTPSGDFRLEARLARMGVSLDPSGAGQGPALVVASAVDSVGVEVSGDTAILWTNLGGTYVQRSAFQVSNNGSGRRSFPYWWYVAIQRVGGTFNAYLSPDRALWALVGSYAVAIAIIQMELQGYDSNGMFACDFVDVVL